VPARTRGAAAEASAPGGPPTAPGALPARPEGGVEGGPPPPTGQLLHDAAGTAVDHPGDDPQERARALASLDDLAREPRARGPHARLGVAPAAAATAARGDPPPPGPERRWGGWPVVAPPPRRATSGAISRAARACGRGPPCPHTTHRRPIASAGGRQSPCEPRRVACLSSRGTAAPRRSHVLGAGRLVSPWGGDVREAGHGRAVNPTAVRGPGVPDAAALTRQPPLPGPLGPLGACHPRPPTRGALWPTRLAAPPLEGLVLAGPRAVGEVACPLRAPTGGAPMGTRAWARGMTRWRERGIRHGIGLPMGIGTDSANFPSAFNVPVVIFLQDYLNLYIPHPGATYGGA
jgi:hypothetical protein